jgi:hypothetical protein
MQPILAAILALALAAAPAAAGVVQTLGERLEGEVTFADGAVEVAGRSVPWAHVIDVVHDSPIRTIPPPGAVRTVGGEVWRGEVLRLAAGRLTVSLALLGEREVTLDRVAAVEFAPPPENGTAAPRARAGPGTLLRQEGEPLPGTLLWIDAGRLAIDSPLGAVTLDRDGCLAYVFHRDGGAAAEGGKDRLTLVNGTILAGTASPGDGVVHVEHAAFGKVEVDASLVRRLERHDPRVRRLAWDGPMHAPCNREVDLVRQAGRAATLVARLTPLAGARGEARVWLAAAGAVLDEFVVRPESAAVPLRLELPPDARHVAVEVNFGRRIGFPCGVRVEDAMCITAGADAR